MSKDDDMALPEGQTCSGCGHFGWCQWFLSREGDEKQCDWSPSRFAWPRPKGEPAR
jgi:hypothetical protein